MCSSQASRTPTSTCGCRRRASSRRAARASGGGGRCRRRRAGPTLGRGRRRVRRCERTDDGGGARRLRARAARALQGAKVGSLRRLVATLRNGQGVEGGAPGVTEAVAPTGPDGRVLSARGTRTRLRLLEAAESVFAEHGYHEASVVKITEAAGVGQGTFYLYFSSKQD